MTIATHRDDTQLAADATALFTHTFGTTPTGVWAAPGRVNLIGEHVDYADGVSIPFALGQSTAAACAPRTDGLLRIVSQADDTLRLDIPLAEVGPNNPANWAGYIAGSIWAGLDSGAIPTCEGMDIALVSDVPVGSGLSSSAALECSVAVAAYELATGTSPDDTARAALVDACIRAENEVVGASTGGLDQRASLFGQPGHALAIDFAANTFTLVPCDMDAAGLVLLIADTNAPHSLADGQYASRRGVIDAVAHDLGSLRTLPNGAEAARTWAQGEHNTAGIEPEVAARRVKHVQEETTRTIEAAHALERADFDTFRRLMADSHISLRDHFEVVTEELESAFQAAGAHGARMTGGGFGGSVIALVPKDQVESTMAAIAAAAKKGGYPEPTFMLATPSAGARRIA
ncbi:galactokinase [Corynebacterium aquilae]|uniref:Galactokinase n=1 Tax=Corynebacterium aquilae DSM 44791 TaxID=1431546 RepID=A0A1L7CFS3_9CORY|nr:galactokinase [Corynebacterium aquilae]APT84676.1 galactokinase [Corynebacterium aquilae DSM 44791]